MQRSPAAQFENTPTPSAPEEGGWELLSEKVLPDAEPPTRTTSALGSTTPATPTSASNLATFNAWKTGAIGALNAMAMVLSVRIVVLMAVAGGIGLTAIALQNPDPYRLGVLGIYALMTVAVVYLLGR